tara:strand:- start:11480 stop:11896 length:417 start_codon:yes stop_codon:yes gene_type:complete
MGMGGAKKKGSISEINVTPLVDVMLVLLVIFMVTAPLMLNGIKLDLPKTKEVNPMNLTTEQVVLSMTTNGNFFIGKDKVLKDELVKIISEKFKERKLDTLFLRADYSIDYGSVAKVMSQLRSGGIEKISLVTESEEKK